MNTDNITPTETPFAETRLGRDIKERADKLREKYPQMDKADLAHHMLTRLESVGGSIMETCRGLSSAEMFAAVMYAVSLEVLMVSAMTGITHAHTVSNLRMLCEDEMELLGIGVAK